MAGVTLMAKIPGNRFSTKWELCWQFMCREKVPPRPQGQRAEPTTNNPFSGFSLTSINLQDIVWQHVMLLIFNECIVLGFGFGGGQPGGFHMSFGIGGKMNYIIYQQYVSNIYRCILVIWFPAGAFPFGFFATNFNFGEERPGPPQVLTIGYAWFFRNLPFFLGWIPSGCWRSVSPQNLSLGKFLVCSAIYTF